MASKRRELVSLIDQGAIPPAQMARAVKVAGLHPSPRAWGVFVDRLLLWLGSLVLAFAVLFFVAYNWADMGRWPRFGLVQGALALAVAIAVWGKASRWVARAALTAASLLVGVLLALFGQVYQTGADPWQLFFIWAVLILPWVLILRFALLWILWLGLLNLAVWLYFRTWGGVLDVWFISSDAVFWWLFALNTTALAVWEWGIKRWGWCSNRWPLRILALGSGLPITLLIMIWIVDAMTYLAPALVAYPLWLAALYGVYRCWRPDLLVVAVGCVSVISVVTLLLARFLIWQGEWQAGSMLMLALVVFAMGAGAVVWLKRLHAEELQ
ncbi:MULTISPECIES: DUF2157 domain-containing protein [unclassified Halomonas]|uniref:DUF2157 domain-containing protein n=1 Tax=unclassified Halomonas TaxID=2609666 RepID=UPI0006DAA362|nr:MULTISPECIES: DUF2157 domain-containing protein [unclassified Halomonas]KPQ20675.1 MAG: putative membrane protein (DUF2157) [Halomonas sp. HL-93]SBR50778.1 Predicted membrane protein (DUF2157) [Halomonas sp. HL-93]SNY97030.1 Predicted membrane protein [Halomonas sp. hl-4]